MNRLLTALAFACDKHRNQRRKDLYASPYVNHAIDLVQLLANEVGIDDERVLVAAILHDTVKNTGTTVQELGREFGSEIADIVSEVYRFQTIPHHVMAAGHPPLGRDAQLSRRAKLVLMADRICNMRDVLSSPPVTWTAQHKREYFDRSRAVIERLRGAHPALATIFDETYRLQP